MPRERYQTWDQTFPDRGTTSRSHPDHKRCPRWRGRKADAALVFLSNPLRDCKQRICCARDP